MNAPLSPLLAQRLEERAWKESPVQIDHTLLLRELAGLLPLARISSLTKIARATLSRINHGKLRATMDQEGKLLDLHNRLRKAKLL